MSFLASLFGAAAAKPIEAIGAAIAKPIEAISKIIDDVYDSDEELLSKKILLQRLAQRPYELQIELNKIEAKHRSIFVAGWRPGVGWVCAIGLAFVVIINPLLAWSTHRPTPDVPERLIFDLILALLGLGTLRTIEKIKKVAK